MTKGSRAKVVYEYSPENEDELQLNVGDIINDVQQAEDGWLEGSVNGRHGVFPDNFVEMLPDEPIVEKRDKKRYARTTYSYVAENEDELSLETGDIVEVLGEEEDGWWSGSYSGRSGVFPNNFVEEISEEEALAAKKKPEEPKPEVLTNPAIAQRSSAESKPKTSRAISGAVKLPFLPPGGTPPTAPSHTEPEPASHDTGKKVEKAKVVFDYEATAEDELTLTVGEVVDILSKDVSEGWWEGRLGSKSGVFPNNFVELLPEEPPAPKKPFMPANKVQVMPNISLADLKPRRPPVDKGSGDKEPPKRPEVRKPTEPPKKPDDPKPTRAAVFPPKPTPAKQPPPASGPKPAAKLPAPAPPGKKPSAGRRPDIPRKKDEGEPKPEVEKPETVKAQPPPKPSPAADSGEKDSGVAPWMKELRKRKNTGETAPAPTPAPAKPEPAKVHPPPAVAAPTPAPVPTPTKSTVTPAKPTPSPSTALPPTTPDPMPSKPAADSVNNIVAAELKDEMAEMKKKMAAMESMFKEEIERLELEIDEEKKSRMTMQVEIDRLKRRKD